MSTPFELRDLTAEDLSLLVQLECDPVMMAHLGGPSKPEDMPGKLQRRLDLMAAGKAWMYVVMVGDQAAGTVGVWDEADATHGETGWMILPEFQGQGLGSTAEMEVLRRARESGHWDVVHAYPAVTNPGSNAICRKCGFTLIEERDFPYAGQTLRCNDWVIKLRSE